MRCIDCSERLVSLGCLLCRREEEGGGDEIGEVGTVPGAGVMWVRIVESGWGLPCSETF